MTALLSDAQTTQVRQALAVFLVHTATLTPVTAGAEDAHGDETTAAGTPVTVACKYRPNDRVRIDEGGVVIVKRPTFKVAATTTIQTGDQIENIRNAGGVVLAAGPFIVGQCLSSDGFGVSLSRRFELRGADPVGGQ